jgi:hypothetical protein
MDIAQWKQTEALAGLFTVPGSPLPPTATRKPFPFRQSIAFFHLFTEQMLLTLCITKQQALEKPGIVLFSGIQSLA